jgi:hypothetical protein
MNIQQILAWVCVMALGFAIHSAIVRILDALRALLRLLEKQ